MSWRALVDAAPELALFGADRLHDQIAYLATLSTDGSPRLHPVRPVVAAGHARTTAGAGSAFPRDERFLLFELGVAAATSTVYGADGRPHRERWRAA